MTTRILLLSKSSVGLEIIILEKILWEGEFTLRSDPWAGLIASCGSFYPMVWFLFSFLPLYFWSLDKEVLLEMNKALRTRDASSDRMFWPLTSSWSPVGNTRLLLRKQTSGRWIIILNIGNEFNLKDKSLPEADTTSQPPCVVFFLMAGRLDLTFIMKSY